MMTADMYSPLLAIHTQDDLNNPVNATIHLTIQHETLGTTHETTLTTGENGLLLHHLPHTLHIDPTGTNAPGQHNITPQATADARENTPGPPTNTDHAHQTYHAGP